MKQLILFFLILFSTSLVFAQTPDEPLPNDPTVNPDANACLDGGVMAGKCNMDIDGDGIPDEDAVSWAWDCGWYLIRFEYGIYSREEFPSHCRSLLPPKPPEPEGLTCYSNGFISLQLIAPLGTLNNVVFYNSPNCTGTPYTSSGGPPGFGVSIFSAPDLPIALAICIGMGGTIPVNLATDLFFNTPPTWYVCLII